MLTYTLNIATAVLALLYLAKDWEAHKKSWRRLVVFGLIIAIGIGGIFNTYYTNKKIDQQHDNDQKTIAGLKVAVDTANKNQIDNTKLFVDAFGKLSQKVSDLQSQVKTVGLREEASKLKAQLEATQKALNPPKARLAFSFIKSIPDGIPLRRIALPVKAGLVHIEFEVINTTAVPAHKPELLLQVCDACEYAVEPKDFIVVPGQNNSQRSRSFDRILPKSLSPTMSADIRVPEGITSMEFGIIYRCDNCDIEDPIANIGTIDLLR
jgi:hypothetical protein